MTNETLYVQRSGRHNWLQMFFTLFLVENWLSIFFKNNTYSKKNSLSKDLLKINKRHTRIRCELFSKLASKKNIRTMPLTSFGCLYCYFWTHFTTFPSVSVTDFGFSWTMYQTEKKAAVAFFLVSKCWLLLSIFNYIEEKIFSNILENFKSWI